MSTDTSIQALNEAFGIDERLRFAEGEGGLTMIEVETPLARARISPYAGQVLSFRPSDVEQDLLFMGGQAYFAEGKAIKGGVPVCWPWFGPDPKDRGRPAHGFVRSRAWDVRATRALDDGSIEVRLGTSDDDFTRELWSYAFDLEIVITVGPTLSIDLVTRNRGGDAFGITQALHTYFLVGDVTKARVLGLEDCRFIDKTANDAVETQNGPVHVAGEVNRIYEGVKGDLIIDDASLDRHIRIRAKNSSTCIVWNPWIETARAMGDLDDEDYKTMLCVETANAASEVISVPAGGEVVLGVELGLDL